MELPTTLATIVGFIIGSIPFGWIIAKLWGISDIRKVGSTNIGATNVVRTAGWLAGALTFILDFSKGFLPMYFLKCHGGSFCTESNMIVGVASVLGHCYSPFLKFHGGKGVSTTLGMLMALNLWMGLASILTYLLTLAVLRVSALGSLFALFVALTFELLFGESLSDKLLLTFIVIVIIYRHRTNWEKLFKKITLFFIVGTMLTSSSQGALQSKTPQRIVALMPNLAETIIDLGKADYLLGAPEFTRLPPKNKIKNLGPYNHLSAETIHALNPDLIIASLDGNDSGLIEQLKNLNHSVVTVNPHSLSEMIQSIKIIATAIGTTDHPLIQKLEKTFEKKMPQNKDHLKNIFIQIGWNPIVTVNQNTFVDELISFAGGKNIFSNAPMQYPRVNADTVIQKNPDVMILCDLTHDGYEAQKAKDFWLQFKNLKAVQSGQVYIVSGDFLLKPGFSLIQGLQILKELI